MRLTLRNLLAWLHGLMSPQDQAAFDELVRTTPKVQPLVDRCKTLYKSRLAAPALDQQSPLHAAESIAAYLDFGMADNQVAAFEKAALASDEQLAEVVACHQIVGDSQAHALAAKTAISRERLLKIGTQQSDALAMVAKEVADGKHGAAVEKPQAELVGAASLGRSEKMEDSGDLSTYLSDTDDEEELSLDAVAARAQQVQQQAVAAAASTFATGATTSTMPRVTMYGSKDPFKQATKAPALLEEKKPPNPMPLIAGAAGGGVLVVGLLIWVVASMFSGGGGGGKPVKQGPHIWGVSTADGKPTAELSGRITFQAGEAGAPVADRGAIVLVWPVNPSEEMPKLTTIRLRQDLDAKQQDAYNKNLTFAKADDDGKYQMRMFDYPEYHVVIISQRGLTNNPKTWGDTIEKMQSQIEDPAGLVGSQLYDYKLLTMPAEKKATLDHTIKGE
jgi:hypothetical protein